MMNMKRLYKFTADLIFPNRCPCCNGFIGWDKLICESCIESFPVISEKICTKCGKTNCMCETKRSFDYCICPTYYEGNIKTGILNLKIKNGVNFAEYFSVPVCEKLNELKITEKIDMIVSVPMTKEKLAERGYNQASVFAEIISQKINKPFYNNLLIKKRNDIIQHELNFEERAESVKGTFGLSNKKFNIIGKKILLCDDVITTSSTLNECASILKQNGAEKVFCAVIATTRLKK